MSMDSSVILPVVVLGLFMSTDSYVILPVVVPGLFVFQELGGLGGGGVPGRVFVL